MDTYKWLINTVLFFLFAALIITLLRMIAPIDTVRGEMINISLFGMIKINRFVWTSIIIIFNLLPVLIFFQKYWVSAILFWVASTALEQARIPIALYARNSWNISISDIYFVILSIEIFFIIIAISLIFGFKRHGKIHEYFLFGKVKEKE